MQLTVPNADALVKITYLLTPWCTALLEKRTGLQLVKKFPAFHGTRRFITALTSVRHLSQWKEHFDKNITKLPAHGLHVSLVYEGFVLPEICIKRVTVVSSFVVCLVGLLFSHVFPTRLWVSVQHLLLNTIFEGSAVTRDFRTPYTGVLISP